MIEEERDTLPPIAETMRPQTADDRIAEVVREVTSTITDGMIKLERVLRSEIQAVRNDVTELRGEVDDLRSRVSYLERTKR